MLPAPHQWHQGFSPNEEVMTSMRTIDRRSFLRYLSTAAVAAALPKSIDRALAIPAHNRSGTIQDVEHIVFLMQENRAFDHYFGMLRGVRGFGDPRPIPLPSGQSVWFQPNGAGVTLPFHPTAPDFGLQFLVDTAHGWADQHAAWNRGKYDNWIAAKETGAVMAFYTRQDIPFFYALADAFTICDAYYCSLMGPTDPNRYHMWTGWVGNDGKGGGPVINNAEKGYDWFTYPERLERAGISWKIYEDIGLGLDAAGVWGFTDDPYIGNFGDNALLYFHEYQNAKPGEPLYEKARTGTNIHVSGNLQDLFGPLRNDVRKNRLPQVSWIVAPEAFSEHGNWPANYGAWYVSQVLDALTSNPDVWSKTALFLMYDENDGFFDHMVPPTPPFEGRGASTVDASNEIFARSADGAKFPYGLGFRVPMVVISPWSKGGWVCSEVFDHTSLIRFIEQRFASGRPDLMESNITAWRRTICGDLTTAFDFEHPNDRPVKLPDTAAYEPPDREKHPDYVPTPPTQQALPSQEPGLRHARALPYELDAEGSADLAHGAFRIDFANTGRVGACFQVYSGNGDLPRTYTVEAGKSLFDSWSAVQGKYDLSVSGPNGFLRTFRGSVSRKLETNLGVESRYDVDDNSVILTITNLGSVASRVTVANAYGNDDAVTRQLSPGQSVRQQWQLKDSYGWYDLSIVTDSDSSFFRRLAGHLENGRDSVSDPALGQS
jgi:phospholipase C